MLEACPLKKILVKKSRPYQFFQRIPETSQIQFCNLYRLVYTKISKPPLFRFLFTTGSSRLPYNPSPTQKCLGLSLGSTNHEVFWIDKTSFLYSWSVLMLNTVIVVRYTYCTAYTVVSGKHTWEKCYTC